MEEKEIIVGKPSYSSRRFALFIGIGLIILAIILFGLNVGGCREYGYGSHTRLRPFTLKQILYTMIPDFWNKSSIVVGISLDIGLILALFGLIINIALSKVSIIVTDKRVYGTANWGKRVDFPLDSISAVAMGAFKGIAVATSSGKISFKGIKNNVEVFEAISALLIKRQNKETSLSVASSKQEHTQSNADELKKFKELLDSGVITQEEFEAKKKQLLGV